MALPPGIGIPGTLAWGEQLAITLGPLTLGKDMNTRVDPPVYTTTYSTGKRIHNPGLSNYPQICTNEAYHQGPSGKDGDQ